MATEFCIKDGYRENPGPVYFLDDPKGDITFQPDVIPHAEAIAAERGLSKIIDVGCGWADKLAVLHERRPDWTLVGVDYGANLQHCIDHYPWGRWIEADLEQPLDLDASGAVVVASDVVEHLVDPRILLWSLAKSGAAAVVISTPERDIQHGEAHMGPSPNLCHVREWNLPELVAFVESCGMAVIEDGLTRGNDVGPALSTSLVVAVPT